MHLVFLIHGLFGNAGHLISMEESISEALRASGRDADFVVHRARSMSAIGTFEGIANNAHKLLDELLAAVKEHRATHISIVGYSMGGLCGRYLVGMLEEAGAFARLKPVVFATFATPHLGSRFPKKSLFGFVFNTLGSLISGLSGRDLFGKTPLLEELATPGSAYMRGLERFDRLCLFANSFNDRTVPFWTAYMAPNNPFSRPSRLDLQLYPDFPMLVDMLRSRRRAGAAAPAPRTTWRRWLLMALFRALVPLLLTIIISLMSVITLISFLKRQLSVSFGPGHNPGKTLIDRVGSALDNALEVGGGTAEQDNDDDGVATNVDGVDAGAAARADRDDSDSDTISSDTISSVSDANEQTALEGPRGKQEKVNLEEHGLRSPGFRGFVESSPRNLDLPPHTLRQMEALNALSWQKFAVKMTSLNTHGEIVDRRNRSPDGKGLLDFFAAVLAQQHSAACARSPRRSRSATPGDSSSSSGDAAAADAEKIHARAKQSHL